MAHRTCTLFIQYTYLWFTTRTLQFTFSFRLQCKMISCRTRTFWCSPTSRICMYKSANNSFNVSAIFCVLANIYDLQYTHTVFDLVRRPNAMTPTEMAERLRLMKLPGVARGTRQWYVQRTCAINGDGLTEGLDWLSNRLKQRKWTSWAHWRPHKARSEDSEHSANKFLLLWHE